MHRRNSQMFDNSHIKLIHHVKNNSCKPISSVGFSRHQRIQPSRSALRYSRAAVYVVRQAVIYLNVKAVI